MSIEEKKQRIQPNHPKLSIQRQCELIELPRSSYYREGLAGQETPKNLELMRLIDNEYTAHPFYGTRQIRNVLRRKGHKINRKRVQRLMRKMGIHTGLTSLILIHGVLLLWVTIKFLLDHEAVTFGFLMKERKKMYLMK